MVFLNLLCFMCLFVAYFFVAFCGWSRSQPPENPAQRGPVTMWGQLRINRQMNSIRDLVVDRSAFDRIIQAGGYISIRSGAAPEANTIPISKPIAEVAMDFIARMNREYLVRSFALASSV